MVRVVAMLLDERFLFKVLTGKITKCFYKIRLTNNHTKRRVIRYGEHNIHLLQKPKGKAEYGIVDVDQVATYILKDVPDEIIIECGYTNREDFYKWCKYWFGITTDIERIGLVTFELHNILRHGKQIFIDKNIPVPQVRW